MRDLESEMNAMTRAFGMPSLRAFDRAFDLDLPALPSAPPAARALACDVQVGVWGLGGWVRAVAVAGGLQMKKEEGFYALRSTGEQRRPALPYWPWQRWQWVPFPWH